MIQPHDDCLIHRVECSAEAGMALWRPVRRLALCDCPICTEAATMPPALLGCDCPQCTFSRGASALVWASPFVVNGCDCCRQLWLSHSGRSNVCPECWDRDLCRVCWERPGIVCEVCHLHVATPYDEAGAP